MIVIIHILARISAETIKLTTQVVGAIILGPSIGNAVIWPPAIASG